MTVLSIRNLGVAVGGQQIINGVDLEISSGQVHAVMGPNGSGKSTLSNAIMGKPGYQITSGSLELDGQDLSALPTWARAQAGFSSLCSTQPKFQVFPFARLWSLL